jgi:hypothetical protein
MADLQSRSILIQLCRHNDTFLRAISSSSSSSPLSLLQLVIAAASDPDEHARKFAAFAIGNAGKSKPHPPIQKKTKTQTPSQNQSLAIAILRNSWSQHFTPTRCTRRLRMIWFRVYFSNGFRVHACLSFRVGAHW